MHEAALLFAVGLVTYASLFLWYATTEALAALKGVVDRLEETLGVLRHSDPSVEGRAAASGPRETSSYSDNNDKET